MAEVIKPPPHGDWTFEFVCKSKWCGATVLGKKEDVRSGTFGGNYAERGEQSYYISCPLCETAHRIPHSEVPPKVAQLANNKANSFDW